jgi:low temperature requirement protein LtrA
MVLSILTSITIAIFSWMVRSTIWPTYFWDSEEIAGPRKATVRATSDRLS